MDTSRVWQKVGASAINCAAVLILTLPFLLFVSIELWKLLTILVFFLYNLIFRRRCLGMRIVHTFIDPPASPLYIVNYTIGYATFFYYVMVPFDLLALNGVAQTVSVMTTGNTLHARLAGQGTLTREQYLAQCKQRAHKILEVDMKSTAVESLIRDLTPWRDLTPSQLEMDLGRILARDGTSEHVRAWIDGFK